MKNVLGIDWGSKYIGLAYLLENEKIPMPIGYLDNNSSFLFSLADIIVRKKIGKIILGYPNKQKNIQEKIDKFTKELGFVISPDIEIYKVNEDYSSVQSGAITSNFQKNPAEDTISAMIILKNRIDKNYQ